MNVLLHLHDSGQSLGSSSSILNAGLYIVFFKLLSRMEGLGACPTISGGCAICEIGQRISHIVVFIGASLSEPHTSGTALRRCVSIRPTDRPCLRLYTVNFINIFRKLNVLVHFNGNAVLLP